MEPVAGAETAPKDTPGDTADPAWDSVPPPTLRVSVLGPLVVTREPEAVRVGSGAPRMVLATLASQAGVWFAVRDLQDALHDIDPSRSWSRSTVHSAVWRLRRALGEDVVESDEVAGYRLDPHRCVVDAEEFAGLALEGRRRLVAGEQGVAAERLAEALQLWRGSAFADWASSEFFAPISRRLEEIRLGAIEDRAEALLRGGQHGTAADMLSTYVMEAPLREHAWALLVEALRVAGRTTDARRAFDQARSVLSEVGLEPGAELAQQRQLLDELAAPTAEPPAAPVDPTPTAVAPPPPSAGEAATPVAAPTERAAWVREPAPAASGPAQGAPRPTPAQDDERPAARPPAPAQDGERLPDWAVLQPPEDHEPPPISVPLPRLPPAVVRATRQPMVGRTGLVEDLVGELQRTRELGGQFVMLEGEAGVGKTRLAAEVAALVHAQGVPVWHLDATPRSDGSMTPVRGWIRRLMRGLSEQGADGLDDPRWTPLLNSTTLPDQPGVPWWEVCDAIARLMWTVCQPAGLVIIDQVDQLTVKALEIFEYFLTRWPQVPILVLGLTRGLGAVPADSIGGPSDAAEALEVWDRLRHLSCFREITVPGLDEHAVGRLLGELARADADADAEPAAQPAAVLTATGGNPRLVEQAQAAAPPEGGGTGLEGSAEDPAVWRAVSQLLAGLPPAAERVVELAAVAAAVRRPITARLLTWAASDTGEFSGAELHQGLTGARQRGLLEKVPDEIDSLNFVHGLVQAALYASLSSSRRMELHGVIAGALEVRNELGAISDPLMLAEHTWRAWPGYPVASRVEVLCRAGDDAVARLAFGEAVTWYGRAREMLLREASEADACTLLNVSLLLGRALLGDGRLGAARQVLASAARTGVACAPECAARATIAWAETASARLTLEDPEIVLARKLLQVPGELSPPARAALLGLVDAASRSRTAELRVRVEPREATGAAPRDEAAFLVRWWWAAPLDERPAITTRLTELAAQLGDDDLQMRAALLAWRTEVQEGRGAFADSARLAAADFALLRAEPETGWLLRTWLCAAAVARGTSWAGVNPGPPVQPSLATDRLTSPGWPFWAGVVEAWGGRSLMAVTGHDAVVREPLLPAPYWLDGIDGRVVSFIDGIARGDPAEWYRAATGARHGATARPATDSELFGTVLAAELLAGADRADHLGSVAAALEPHQHRHALLALTYYHRCVHHTLGVVHQAMGNLDDAVEHFEAAVDAHRLVGAHEARRGSMARLAEAHRLRGTALDVAVAGRLLREASAGLSTLSQRLDQFRSA